MSGPATAAGVTPNDRAVVAGQLGRRPRGLSHVVVRCPFGYPAVTESAPVLAEGEPNPTLLYLTCPSLDTVISRVEAAGGVRSLRTMCRRDSDLGAYLAKVTSIYQQRRQALWASSGASPSELPRLEAGIGGPVDAEHASCLHAYSATLLAVMSGGLGAEDPELARRAAQVWTRLLPPVETGWCTDGRCAKWDAGGKRAVIDVGTISVRVLVADMVEGRPRSLLRKAEVTRLGQGLVTGGRLDGAARKRTAEVIARFVRDARGLGAEQVILVGTSAARDASDGQDFIKGLAEEHDLRAEILSGSREAELAYEGVSLDVADAVVIDVGGGSTELVTRRHDGTLVAQSLQLGASRGTEKWIASDPPAAYELDAVAREAGEEFGGLRDLFGAGGAGRPGGADSGPRRLVGVAGTITTLAALSAGLDSYDSAAIHLRTLTLDEITGLLSLLAGLTTEERAALPCVQAGRAPVIVAGAAIVAAAMRELGYEELIVSERDLLDGVLMAEG